MYSCPVSEKTKKNNITREGVGEGGGGKGGELPT